jgi:heptaprenyl diphosphate synthase
LLTLLAAQYGDPHAPDVVPAAVVCELTHLATLYHDDVMDEALLRRGTESANSRWGNTVAILTGVRVLFWVPCGLGLLGVLSTVNGFMLLI